MIGCWIDGEIVQYPHEWPMVSSAVSLLRRLWGWRETVSMIDIGANNGHTSLSLLKSGWVGHSVAVEPEQGNFERLVLNCGANDSSWEMTCIQSAVGDKVGKVTMELNPRNNGDHRVRMVPVEGTEECHGESSWETVTVDCTTLADIVEKNQCLQGGRLGLVWIDVEGYEGYVFRGGSNLLWNIPTVAEVWPYGMMRAGMTTIEYADIVKSIWKWVWVLKDNTEDVWEQHPIEYITKHMAKMGAFCNVIYTPEIPSGLR